MFKENDDHNDRISDNGEQCENHKFPSNLNWPNLMLIENNSSQWTKLGSILKVTEIGHNGRSKFAMKQYLYININLTLKNKIVSLAASSLSLSSVVSNVIFHYLVLCLVAFGFCCCADLTATTSKQLEKSK